MISSSATPWSDRQCDRPTGTLYGVGVGPGDPDLITVKGVNLIQQASVVAFPAGMGGKPGIAEQIAEKWCLPHQKRLALTFPYVHDPAVLETAWKDAAVTVLEFLHQGDGVVFLCEGDISFYSTFTYLAQTLSTLASDVSIQAIPGVCSPMAAAAIAGYPLTRQGDRLTILPALYRMADFETALDTAEVVVLMKLKSVYEHVWKVLHQRNLLAQSYVVEWATWPQQAIYRDLGDRPTLNLSYFSILIVQISPDLP